MKPGSGSTREDCRPRKTPDDRGKHNVGVIGIGVARGYRVWAMRTAPKPSSMATLTPKRPRTKPEGTRGFLYRGPDYRRNVTAPTVHAAELLGSDYRLPLSTPSSSRLPSLSGPRSKPNLPRVVGSLLTSTGPYPLTRVHSHIISRKHASGCAIAEPSWNSRQSSTAARSRYGLTLKPVGLET